MRQAHQGLLVPLPFEACDSMGKHVQITIILKVKFTYFTNQGGLSLPGSSSWLSFSDGTRRTLGSIGVNSIDQPAVHWRTPGTYPVTARVSRRTLTRFEMVGSRVIRVCLAGTVLSRMRPDLTSADELDTRHP